MTKMFNVSGFGFLVSSLELNPSTFLPLRRCAVMPLCRYTVAPLRRCAVAPLCRCAVAPFCRFVILQHKDMTIFIVTQIFFNKNDYFFSP